MQLLPQKTNALELKMDLPLSMIMNKEDYQPGMVIKASKIFLEMKNVFPVQKRKLLFASKKFALEVLWFRDANALIKTALKTVS